MDPKVFRGTGKAWEVHFHLEPGIDAGGPYRESITQMCKDVHDPVDVPGRLPLCIPIPSKYQSDAPFQDRWHPDPSCTEWDLYNWLGKLMGIALRTDFKLDLDLSAVLWKGLCSESVSWQDLKAFDYAMYQSVKGIMDDRALLAQGVDASNFVDIMCQTFEFTRNDGTTVELVDGGSEIPLTWERREEWAHLVGSLRLNESTRQIDAIRDGVGTIVPLEVLSLFTWRELELMVCGSPEIDIEILKTTCRYSSLSSSDRRVRHFWAAFERFTQEQRSAFLQFTWGRGRLPNRLVGDDSLYLTPMHHHTPDEALPVSHTCFFQLELPDYSTVEIAYEKILYAIYNCNFFGEG